MLQSVVEEKMKFGHKITSRRLFKAEVELMTSVISHLNSSNIYVGYIYDALFCCHKDTALVIDAMNFVAYSKGIKTWAERE